MTTTDIPIPDFEELFARDPLSLTREDIMSTLPLWRQQRSKFMLTPKAAATPKPVKKVIDLADLGLVKK